MSTKEETPQMPGKVLRERLDLLGINQRELGDIMGHTQPWISDVIVGRKTITSRSATELGAALGTGPGYWLMLRDKYQLWELSQEEAHVRHLEEIRKRAKARGL